MRHTRAEGLDYAGRFDAGNHRLWGSATLVSTIASHADIAEIPPTDFHLYTDLAWTRARIGHFQYAQHVWRTSLGKGHSLHAYLLTSTRCSTWPAVYVCEIAGSRPTSQGLD